MQPIPIPPPYGGINEQIPVIAIQSPNCESLLNFNITEAGIELRHGDSVYYKQAGSNYDLQNVFVYGSKIIAIAFNRNTNANDYIDIPSGTVDFSSAATIVGDTSYPLTFNRYLFMFSSQNPPGYYFNGSAWNAIGYTGTGFTSAFGGAVYKRRAYLIDSNSLAVYWYTGIDAITGVLTKVDLTSIFSDVCSLTNIARITLADNVSSVSLLAFVSSAGEILFYSGSYPDSTDWGEQGRARVGQPLFQGPAGGMEYQGDYLLFTKDGVVSLRDLFLKGSEQGVAFSINSYIEKTWKEITAQSAGFGIFGVYDSNNKRIVIMFPVTADGTNNMFYFIFDCTLKAWYFHRNYTTDLSSEFLYGLVIPLANRELYYGISNTVAGNFVIYKKEGASGFTDRSIDDASEVGYNYEFISAPLAEGRSYVQKVEGMDVIIESDLYNETGYQLIADLGVQTTQTQKVPSQPSGVQKPFVNVGIEGTYLQVEISGTTTSGKTIGYNLYGLDVWKDRGANPR